MDNAALWGRALGYCEWKYLNMTVQLPGVWVLRGCCFHVVFSKPGPPPVRKAPLQLGSKLQRSFWEAAGGSIIVLSLPSSGRKREGRDASLIGPEGTYRAASEKHQRMTVTIKVVSSHSLSKPVLLPGKTKTHTHKKKNLLPVSPPANHVLWGLPAISSFNLFHYHENDRCTSFKN